MGSAPASRRRVRARDTFVCCVVCWLFGWSVATFATPASALTPPACPTSASGYATYAAQIGSFLLQLQTADGAIPDAPGSPLVNEDSNMQYALIGLGAAYATTGDASFLTALERGIAWLAEREEMIDPAWRGSWRYAYAATPPYAPVAVSPGRGVVDVRGVDATSALFVYLLGLHQSLTGRTDLVDQWAAHARAALDFLLTRNRAADGFFFSSWQQHAAGGPWELWRFQYAADQADVHLGLRAGAQLYDTPSFAYRDAADWLAAQVPARFFDPATGRFAVGRYEDGALDVGPNGFDAVFAQGHLSWILPGTPETTSAASWLASRVRRSGAIVTRGRSYSLSVAMLGLSAAARGAPPPTPSFCWVLQRAFDPATGAVHDTGFRRTPMYVNVAGLVLASFLGFVP